MKRRTSKGIEKLREADLRHNQAASLAAIKEAQLHPQILELNDELPERQPLFGHRFIPKKSPNGVFLGWYRPGQRSGKPSSRLPLQDETDAKEIGFAQLVLDARRLEAQVFKIKSHTHIEAGSKSGVNRQATKQAILAEYERFSLKNLPPHTIASIVARTIGVTPRHVRETVQQEKRKRTLT